MEEGKNNGGTIMITNDDGIDAPGLRALVKALLDNNLYNLQICAPALYVT
jgi:5'-nucleotidase